jgi:amidohydrolase
VGVVATRSGPMLASADKFEVVITGRGGHAASPHLTVDPIALSGLVINAVHQIVSRRINPTEPAVITIATIKGGTVNNVIPDTVTMTGTIRAFSAETRAALHTELGKAVRVVESLGGSADLKIDFGYPPTVNTADAYAVMQGAMQELLGEDKIIESPMIMGAEDFSYMAQAAPGSFLFLGVKDPAWEQEYPVHRADFRMDERALPIGAASLAASAIAWMEKE